MPIVTPTLNIPLPTASSTKATPAVATPSAAATPAPAPKLPDAPSTTVTLSPQALSAAYAASHPSSPAASPTPALASAAHDGSGYEALKNGISTAAADVGDAIVEGAQAVVDGVETTLSTAHKVAKGILELPFAVVAKGCDAVGSLIEEI